MFSEHLTRWQFLGIGVAVADRPEGPFVDALGRPLIDKFRNGAQPIDPFVFRDDDGQHYLYYGGWRHCNVVRLSPDLLALVPFADGTTFKDITPADYVEGPFVFKRDGKNYSPDFAAVARAFGVDGVRIESAQQFRPAFEHAIASGKPVVIDVAMMNEPVPTAGHWNINAIYSPDKMVSHVAVA